jgi:hypothetical protein
MRPTLIDEFNLSHDAINLNQICLRKVVVVIGSTAAAMVTMCCDEFNTKLMWTG